MSERTEQPTERRRSEARRRGEGVGRSHELAMGLTLGIAVLGAAALLPGTGRALASTLQQAIEQAGTRSISSGQLTAALGRGLLQWVRLVGPLALLVTFAGVAANLAGGGLVFSLHSIRFDGGRLNPAQGLRRLADRQAILRLGIALAKLAVLAAVGWQVASTSIPPMLAMSGAGIGPIGAVALAAVYRLGLSITVLIAGVAAVDFVVQRRRALGQLRMTRDELRREIREEQGDPFIRAARRRRARQIAFARMMQAVPRADVVVTNPTHLAVALKYDSLTMRAPRIVAKGQRLMAERIKTIAREHHVPIMEDRPLARALFARPLGSEIPAHLYRAVARLLVLVQRARFGMRRTAAQRPARPNPGPARTWPGPTGSVADARRSLGMATAVASDPVGGTR